MQRCVPRFWNFAFCGLFALAIPLGGAGWAIGDELDCLSVDERSNARLYGRLQEQAYAALERRAAAYEQLRSDEQIQSYQQRMKDFLIAQLGGLPQRSPLNARTLGTISADGYRIEKVIFASQPHHHITANLYLPDADQPVPGVVVSSGHSRTAKTAEYNQRFGIAMALGGMAALCFDPIGQGERSQLLDDSGKPRFSGTTTEHFLVGVGSILVGRNTARYRVWDAIRAIDYLQSRPEVDAKRIGMTGCSGGGTLTSYTMAIDERIVCAVPACYLTTFRKLIETIGPQDAEQNIFGQLAFGLDQPDYVLMRAPRATLISSTTGDFFDIDGSWDNFRQAKRIYGRLGFPERVDLVEMEGNHGVKPQNLASITQWMRRWLLGVDEPVAIREYQPRDPSELLCLESGQVLTLDGEWSVMDLNANYETRLAAERLANQETLGDDQLRQQIREVAGIAPREEFKPPAWEDRGRVKRQDYHIDKVVLRTPGEAPITALTFHPSSPSDEAYVYLHDQGKLGDSEAGGAIEEIVGKGMAVVSVDLRGQGETAAEPLRNADLLTDWKTYYLSYLLGKPLLGGRVDDALAAADFVRFYQKERTDPRTVHLVGVGRAGIIALHAAALEPDWFESITLRDTTRSWASVVRSNVPGGQLDATVHGALRVYDLPDLVRLAGKSKVHYVND